MCMIVATVDHIGICALRASAAQLRLVDIVGLLILTPSPPPILFLISTLLLY